MASRIVVRVDQVLENMNAFVRKKCEATGPTGTVDGAAAEERGCTWRDDADMQKRLSNVKAASQAFAMSCSKLALLARQQPSPEASQSLDDELLASADILLVCFLQAADCSICPPLFYHVQQLLRSQLLTAKEFMEALCQEPTDFDAISNGAAVVFKIYDKVQLLPMTNKAAYRRFLMEKMSLVKDTIVEFEGCVREAGEQAEGNGETCEEGGGESFGEAGEGGGDVRNGSGSVEVRDDHDDEDGDEEEAPYTPKEVATAESCLHLVRCAFDALKTCLAVMTHVADLHSPSAAESSGAAGAGTAAVFACTDSARAVCEAWVAQLYIYVKATEGGVTDLGAELYSPFDAAQILEYYDVLGATLAALCRSLGRDDYQELLSDDMRRQLGVLEVTLAEIGVCTFISS